MVRKAFKAFVLAACAAFAGCNSGAAGTGAPVPAVVAANGAISQPTSSTRVIQDFAVMVPGAATTCPSGMLPLSASRVPAGNTRSTAGVAALPGGIAALPGGIAALPGGIGALPGLASVCSGKTKKGAHVTALLGGKHAGNQVCPGGGPGALNCGALKRSDIAPLPVVFPDEGAIPGIHPDDLIEAYNLPETGGSGQTVGIIDAYDNPNAETDLAVYRQEFGLPPCTTANGCFREVAGQNGKIPVANASWAMEISLDLDMVSAVCPNCKIVLVEAKSDQMQDLSSAVDAAVAAGATVISNSYYAAESSLKGDDMKQAAPHYSKAGVPMTVSSGDDGYGATFPASLPNVIAVGGTTLNRTAADRGWYETAWKGSGAGCSASSTKPSWQHDGGCANRTVSDVAVVGDPDTGAAVYNTYGGGGWSVVGGTSMGAPIVASMIALAGDASTFSGLKLYANAAHMFPISEGSDGLCNGSYLCQAIGGYSGPTGLGTPNGIGAF